MQQKMIFSEWLNNEQLERVKFEWKYLNVFQRKVLRLRAAMYIFYLSPLTLRRRLIAAAERRFYPAHWVR